MDAPKEFVFYSAVDFSVLEEVARYANKAVILVARSVAGNDKVPAIYASVGGHSGKRHRYASHLALDVETAATPLNY